MALRRFFIEKSQLDQETVRLDGDLFHHVRDVCRFGEGDEFEVLVGDGLARRVRIAAVAKRDLTATVISTRELPPAPRPAVTLAVSIPKLPKVDWIIEKCVELGVTEIRPFVSAYSFLRKTSEISENRLARWRKLVQSATQQSGRGDLMTIAEPVTLDELLREFKARPNAAAVFPYEGEARLDLRGTIDAIKAKSPEEVWAFVGSEGGFSTEEVERFARDGIASTSMGEQILRVETACLALVSVLKYELGSLR